MVGSERHTLVRLLVRALMRGFVVEQPRLRLWLMSRRCLPSPIGRFFISDDLLLAANEVGTFLLLIALIFFSPLRRLHLLEQTVDQRGSQRLDNLGLLHATTG